MSKNKPTINKQYTVDGTSFQSKDSAIAAAQCALTKSVHLACQMEGYKFSSISFREIVMLEPVDCICVEAEAIARDRFSEYRLDGDETRRFITTSDPSSPVFGRYIARVWTTELLIFWFGIYSSLPASGLYSPEERFCGHLASVLRAWTSGRRPAIDLIRKLPKRWNLASNELQRNQTAEILLAAQDLGLLNDLSFHDILMNCDQVAERAAELAQVRSLPQSVAPSP